MRYARKNIVAVKRLGVAFAEKLYDGTTTAAVFNGWFEDSLIPMLNVGDVIIMDNARFHNSAHSPIYEEYDTAKRVLEETKEIKASIEETLNRIKAI